MDYQFSIAHLTVLGCPPPEVVRIAANCGYEYVSLRPIYMGLPGEPNYDLANLPAMLAQTRQAMADTGVRLHDIELARVYEEMDMEKYRRAMNVAAELGGKCVLSSIWTEDKPFYIDRFGQLCDMAAQFGLSVDLEFVTWAGVKNLQEAKEVLLAVNRPNMGLMVDTLHFHRSRVELSELDGLPSAWFHFAHICDAPAKIPTDKEGLIHTGRDERLYVGEGAIDIAAIMNRLPVSVCSIELPHLQRVAEYGYEEHARRCLLQAKEYFTAQQVTGKQ